MSAKAQKVQRESWEAVEVEVGKRRLRAQAEVFKYASMTLLPQAISPRDTEALVAWAFTCNLV